jgi:RNA polymerase sigma-70 factor (ECF subfamily)
MVVEHMKITDEEIIAKVVSGQADFFAEIVDRYQKKLLRYATYLLRDHDVAQDVVQDGFINAYKNLKGFNTNKKFSSWIYRIVHNLGMNAVRNKWRILPMLPDFDWPSSENLEEELISKETAFQVQQCLAKLDLKYAEPLALYYLEEKSYREISEILRIPEGTVAIRINRAKKIMKSICENKKK